MPNGWPATFASLIAINSSIAVYFIPALLNQFQTEDIQFKLFNQRQAGIQTAYCYYMIDD